MSAGLRASTDAPASAAPEASLTVPAMTPCPKATAGQAKSQAARTHVVRVTRRHLRKQCHILDDLGHFAKGVGVHVQNFHPSVKLTPKSLLFWPSGGSPSKLS